MDDVRGLFLGMPHGTTPAAVTTNENIIMSSFKSSRDIQKKEGGPDSSENKGADQLRGYREADLRLCFRICKTLVFP